MAKRFTDEELSNIIIDYQNGLRPFELSSKYGRDSGTIIGKLKEIGVYRNRNVRATEQDVEIISQLYSQRKWNEIFELYPNWTKNKIHTLMSQNKVSCSSAYWSSSDIKYLMENYGILDNKEIAHKLKRSYSSVVTKAYKLGLKTRELWSDEEITVLKENYPYKTVDEVAILLPKRSRKTIIMKACDLKIKNVSMYDEDSKEYIVANFKNMTDGEMGAYLGKTPSSVTSLRYRLGLFKQSEFSSFCMFKEVFRKQISDWKQKSMEKCDYKCVVTGESFTHIHHLYSFANICQEALCKSGVDLSKPFQEYRNNMHDIIEMFVLIHNTYPLGVCLSEKVHLDFHRKYGNRNNTPEQWEEFIKSYSE